MFPSQSKQRFLLSLNIRELTNIPKPSGSCYVKWSIKESATSTIKGKTPKTHIKDYKVHWNSTSESIIKIGINKSKNNELLPKILVLKVYLIPHQHHTHKRNSSINSSINSNGNKFPVHTPTLQNFEDLIPISPHKSDSETQYLGKVSINLSEFVQFNDQKEILIRNLLMDSKINAILNIRVSLELIKGNKNDFKVPPMNSDFKNKGLISSILTNCDSLDGQSVNNGGTAQSPTSTSYSGTQINPDGSLSQVSKSLMIVSDPIVTKLYEKTFEVSWDLRQGEYNAIEAVDDIFQGGDGWAKNEDGVRLIDLQDEKLNTKMQQVRSKFKLYDKLTNIKESDIRSDLKSWHVEHI